MDNLNSNTNQKLKPEPKKAPALFTKNQLVSSEKYKDRKDALNVLLSDDKNYSFEETDKILNDFMKGKVN